MASDYIADICKDLLDYLETHFEAASVSPSGSNTLPENRYFDWGPSTSMITDDECNEMLVVWHDGITHKNIPNAQNACQVLPETIICVDLWRCIPQIIDGCYPSSEEYTESATELSRDLWTLQNLVYRYVYEELECEIKQHVSSTQLTRQGGVGGNRICWMQSLTDPSPPAPVESS